MNRIMAKPAYFFLSSVFSLFFSGSGCWVIVVDVVVVVVVDVVVDFGTGFSDFKISVAFLSVSSFKSVV